MPPQSPSPRSAKSPRGKSRSFRIGRVRAFLRNRTWYLGYQEQGRRRQPRVGTSREEARRLASEVNAQLEAGAPSALGFEPISPAELRQRWLHHHEHVRRSSLHTLDRYRTATEYLLRFLDRVQPLRRISDLRPHHVEEFVRHLRSLRVAPNGHPHTTHRRLRDSGVKYILETCCTLLNYAARHRHLPPYAENPFRLAEVARIPIEDAKPIIVFSATQEQQLLEACDAWQFPIFLTLLLTGLRVGEITHLLLPADLDLQEGWLVVCNKPALGWKVKTRSERRIPLLSPLVRVLRQVIGNRTTGPVFQQRRCQQDHRAPLARLTVKALEQEVQRRILQAGEDDRRSVAAVTKALWRDMGALREDWIRLEFMRLTAGIGLPEITAPKTMRHTFATCLQDANVDPLVRNQLMGHAPGSPVPGSQGLGMTSVYTHTRPETLRSQLQMALDLRPALQLGARWCDD